MSGYPMEKPLESKHVLLIDEDKCDNCGKCVEICPTSALKTVDKRLLVDQVNCIACYGCVIICEKKALRIKWLYY